VLDSPRALEMG